MWNSGVSSGHILASVPLGEEKLVGAHFLDLSPLLVCKENSDTAGGLLRILTRLTREEIQAVRAHLNLYVGTIAPQVLV